MEFVKILIFKLFCLLFVYSRVPGPRNDFFLSRLSPFVHMI